MRGWPALLLVALLAGCASAPGFAQESAQASASASIQASPPPLRVWLQFVNEMSVDRGIELDTPAGRLEWSRITACRMGASGPHGPGWTLSVGAADRKGPVGHYRAVLSAADFVGGGDHVARIEFLADGEVRVRVDQDPQDFVMTPVTGCVPSSR